MVTENKDYELIPLEEDAEHWGIRILEGPFAETVFRYGNVEITGKGKNTAIKFNFFILSSPDEDLEVETNESLQRFAGDILYDVVATNRTQGLTGEITHKEAEKKYYLSEPE